MSRVLVTGAGGFIGRQALPLLAESGFEVHALALHAPAATGPRVTWHTCDLMSAEQTARLMRAVRPSHLLHLAWYTQPGQYLESPENFRWVSATLDLLHAFHAHGGTRAVMTGTCAEYDLSGGRCDERETPLTPLTVYGRCKHALQLLLSAYSAATGLSSVWARIFYLYGPHERRERLVPSVITSLLAGQLAKPTHGQQVRDFLHVGDVAAALVKVLGSGYEGPINIASGQAVTVKDVVTTIAREIGRPDLVAIGALAASPADAPVVVGEAQRLAQLGWTPRYTLEEGLRDTIDWWRTQGDAA